MQQGFPSQGRDRRRNSRYPCECIVTISRLLSQRQVTGRMLNLSVSGCLAISDEAGIFGSNDLVELSFSVHGYSIRVLASIRDLRSYNSMGLEFVDRNPETLWQIGELVRKLAEDWAKQDAPQPLP
jgi:hypothetical protein